MCHLPIQNLCHLILHLTIKKVKKKVYCTLNNHTSFLDTLAREKDRLMKLCRITTILLDRVCRGV